MTGLKIICIDDEELVLNLTVSLCRELPMKPEAIGFERPGEALLWLKDHTADIAIMDINMPEMNGLTLTERVKKLRPEISIIFLTGYPEYALKAFELHASGYIIKPVGRERLLSEIQYVISHNRKSEPHAHIEAYTFGEFDLMVDGVSVHFSRARAKELLAYLIDRNGKSVSRAKVFAVLYEDRQYDHSMQKQLDVIIRSLRETLRKYGIEDIFELKSGYLRICPEKISCDMYRFMSGDIDAINSYRGEYMSDYSWATLTEAFMGQSVYEQNES